VAYRGPGFGSTWNIRIVSGSAAVSIANEVTVGTAFLPTAPGRCESWRGSLPKAATPVLTILAAVDVVLHSPSLKELCAPGAAKISRLHGVYKSDGHFTASLAVVFCATYIYGSSLAHNTLLHGP
jgi:hypothetical protein